jgi:hypothetical protein
VTVEEAALAASLPVALPGVGLQGSGADAQGHGRDGDEATANSGRSVRRDRVALQSDQAISA